MPEAIHQVNTTLPVRATSRYVPDTNVCLDLFVFGSTRCESLRAALQAGEIELVTRDDCRDEWLRVLRYDHLNLDDDARVAAEALFERWVTCLPVAQSTRDSYAELPRCSDPDDQKFLELALACSANALLTRDKQLLRLARRTARIGLFAILPPTAWADVMVVA